MNKFYALAFLLFSSSLVFSQKNKTKITETSKPFVLGRIDEIESKELGEKRILNIYLPEGYNANDATKYPVIYLLDGSADEDFIHVTGLVQFNSFEWINQVPKSIVVGIATVDRRRDFTYPTTVENDKTRFPTTGHSDQFIAFIEKELQPFIDKKYKTNESKMIIGQSLGGLLETEILLKKPSLFNKYVIVSPSLWWDNGSLLNLDSEILKESFNQKTEIYIAVGKEGLTPTEIPRVMEVDANLLAEKIKLSKSKNIKVYFDYFPEENHGTILHPAVANSFKFFYPQVKE
ncbi:putative alpha/beta superfamily hydrolase [Flavobacterium nitrogenifigens]|uniref:Alpha/beta superfamily hydrolase n=2 Tax=Flavobacterium TaxID=237 RepID=A0ABR6QIU4_9FLAO|nr:MULTISPECIES: alpha/beta hydrolase-fold protein [Flavobacterium]MBB4804176.1 putative alpha/beta superfamily hydrolase [Flavobacterium nitrogenifigens]MBB6389135.1 putative alpha/beta superfamily hydrolase [Flavobacterium notoginsengisoli]